jgi:hypothetical protein
MMSTVGLTGQKAPVSELRTCRLCSPAAGLLNALRCPEAVVMLCVSLSISAAASTEWTSMPGCSSMSSDL